jgi:hypothetical protein
MKAAQQRRTPKRGAANRTTGNACALECGGVPPLLHIPEKETRCLLESATAAEPTLR